MSQVVLDRAGSTIRGASLVTERGKRRLSRLASVSLTLGVLVSVWGLHLAWNVAPLEKTLRWSQKIFYFHAPLGIWSLCLFGLGAGAAVLYLITRDVRADLLGEAAMELALLGCAVVLVTGALWAKPAWGSWFPYEDPRLASMMVLFLLSLAYRSLRGSMGEGSRRARFSAVVAILGAANALVVYFAIRIWDSTHPQVLGQGGGGMPPEMERAFYWCLLATACLAFGLLVGRYRLARLHHEHARLRQLQQDSGNP